MLLAFVVFQLHAIHMALGSRKKLGHIVGGSGEQGRLSREATRVKNFDAAPGNFEIPDKEGCAKQCGGAVAHWTWSSKSGNKCVCEGSAEQVSEVEDPNPDACGKKCPGGYDWKWNQDEGNICTCKGAPASIVGDQKENEACTKKCHGQPWRWTWKPEDGFVCVCDGSASHAEPSDRHGARHGAASQSRNPNPNPTGRKRGHGGDDKHETDDKKRGAKEQTRGEKESGRRRKEGGGRKADKTEERRKMEKEAKRKADEERRRKEHEERRRADVRQKQRDAKAEAEIKSRWDKVKKERTDAKTEFERVKAQIEKRREAYKIEMKAVNTDRAHANKQYEEIQMLKKKIQKSRDPSEIAQLQSALDSKEVAYKFTDSGITYRLQMVESKRVDVERSWEDAQFKFNARRKIYEAEMEAIEEEQRKLRRK